MKYAIHASVILAVSTGLVLGGDGPNEQDVKAELDKFQGTWQLVSAETDGKKAPADLVAKIRVVIRGNKHTVLIKGVDSPAKEIPFKIDPTKKPKTVDDQLADSKQIHGIYELDGDTLKSCVAAIGKERPTEFAATPGTGHTLRVFKRIKP
jgi:uncharacterized protein (TIGR03067 family)